MTERRRFLAVCALAALSAALGPEDASALQSYFINNEVQADNVEMFPKWMDMLSRYDSQSKPYQAICGGKDKYSPCKLAGWKTFLEGQRDKKIMDQLVAIDSFINQYPYVEDIVNWGVEDIWNTPYEFQQKGGDCEDYAISKYMSLRAIGVPEEMMRIQIVSDLNLGGVIHAILIVFVDGQVYVLDNQIKQVMLAVNIYHYKPIFSINEHHWWRQIMIQ
jgi:predicted transglutaminase-like cysteine proteinase